MRLRPIPAMLERPILRSSLHLQLRHPHRTPKCLHIPAICSRNIRSFSKPQPTHQRSPLSQPRLFHSSASARIDILADSDKGKDKAAEPHRVPKEEAPLSDEEYHERSDAFIEELVEKLEMLAEERLDVDVEYSAGVLTIDFPPAGTYVLNKQPPNKQLWLSSPVSGPKRFNWVVMGDAMDQKGSAGTNDWVYLKDGTTLSGLVKRELGVEVGSEGDSL